MKKLIIMLAAIAMVGAFTASAMAEVSVYGSARMWTYRVHQDEQAATGAFSTDNTVWKMGPFSRFGAKFKSDKITGHFEMDARDTNNDGASGVGDMRLRILWGEWDFGAGKLGLGQNWPVSNWFITMNQYTGDGLQDYGSVGMSFARYAYIELTFGDLHIALGAPDIAVGAPVGSTYTQRTETTLPKFEILYNLKLSQMELNFLGGYQNYKIYNITNSDKDITSYLLAVRGEFHFGPAYLKASVRYDQNGGNYGVASAVRSAAQWNTVSNDIEDSHTWGAAGTVGYKVNDMFTIEAYYGKTKSKDDRPGTYEDEAQMYGVTAQITLAPGVYLFPEAMVLDGMTQQNGALGETDQGKTTVFGMVWMINFK
jgi:hypothetical protein